VTVLVTGVLGILQGLRHALEPDHLAAVSTLASGETPRSGFRLGAWWGLGHALTLAAVGGTLAALGRMLPVRMATSCELAVAAMLVLLGLRAMQRALAEGREAHVSGSTGPDHAHELPLRHVHLRGNAVAIRPLLVGVVHGLAGSGAISAVVLAELPGTIERLTAIACFGAGSILGMAGASGMLGVPLWRLRARPRLASALMLGIGVTSALLGIAWGADAARALATR
jgi:hypothetical protein